ncbi:S-adenosyl-L-methionine-dependent methyltransferase [Sporodiniella umbellata]|nr:S-adenosyl-L-methionine-dependent methyltransferase [Sporodiniella umbellata]
MGNCVASTKPSIHKRLPESEKTTYFASTDIDTLTTEPCTVINPESLVTKREFHNNEASTYWLPKDREEHDRLTAQHFCFKELFKGNISSSVKETLDFENGISILDIGCGSGAWLADMNFEYPKCTYYGCDIIEAPDIIQKLPCLNFLHGSVAQGLPYTDNMFDFVHMRFFVYALRADEWPYAIKEAIRVTKPGGMIQFVDGSPEAPKDTNSACYRVMNEMYSISMERKQIPDIAYKLEDLVSLNTNIKIVQSFHKINNSNEETLLAKKFAWDFGKAVEGMMPHIGPRLGLESKQDISNYLTEFKKDLPINGFKLVNVSLSIQKICE